MSLKLSPAGYADFDTVTGLPGNPEAVVSGRAVAQALTTLGVGWYEIAGNVLEKVTRSGPSPQSALGQGSGQAAQSALGQGSGQAAQAVIVPAIYSARSAQAAGYSSDWGGRIQEYLEKTPSAGSPQKSIIEEKIKQIASGSDISKYVKYAFYIFAGLVVVKILGFIREVLT